MVRVPATVLHMGTTSFRRKNCGSSLSCRYICSDMRGAQTAAAGGGQESTDGRRTCVTGHLLQASWRAGQTHHDHDQSDAQRHDEPHEDDDRLRRGRAAS